MIDLTRIIDMNAHMAKWDASADDYSMYSKRELTPIEFRTEITKSGSTKYRLIVAEDMKNPFTYDVDEEAKALIEYAIATNQQVRVYISKMLAPWANGGLVMALSNNK